jgi:hypothetical protein
MAQTHLQRRNGCFYYRQKIPADLLVHFGQREVVAACARANAARRAPRATSRGTIGLGSLRGSARAASRRFLER